MISYNNASLLIIDDTHSFHDQHQVSFIFIALYTLDATESIKCLSQSEACVGGASLKALCTRDEMDTFII